MTTQTVRSILRLVAVLTVFVGGIGIWTSVISAFAFRQFVVNAMDSMEVHASLAGAGWFGVLSWSVVAAGGGVFYALSAGIARHVTGESVAPVRAPAARHEGRS
ncbi:MAG: hypothetical protein JNL28_01195 [Planctomycetes bacterium]|nr:hypothetical protein [Planctomycetota bacterium]